MWSSIAMTNGLRAIRAGSNSSTAATAQRMTVGTNSHSRSNRRAAELFPRYSASSGGMTIPSIVRRTCIDSRSISQPPTKHRPFKLDRVISSIPWICPTTNLGLSRSGSGCRRTGASKRDLATATGASSIRSCWLIRHSISMHSASCQEGSKTAPMANC